MKQSLAQKILSTVSEIYFVGKIDRKNKEKLDFMIVETNYTEIGNIQYLADIIQLNNSLSHYIEEIIKDLDRVTKFEEYVSKHHRISYIDENIWIIWINYEWDKELRKAYNQLEAQKNLLQLFIDAIPDLVFYKDIKGKYIICNKLFADIFEKEKEEIIGKTDQEIDVFISRANEYRAFDQKVIQSHNSFQQEEIFYLPNGQKRIGESVKVPFVGTDNKVMGIIGISRDITEKRAIEQQVKQNEQRFRKVLENITDAIVLIEGGEVLEVNPAYQKIYGKVIDDNKALEIKQMIEKQSNKDFDETTYKEWTHITQVNGQGEQEKWVNIHYTCIDENSKTGLMIISDITSKILKEQELERLRSEFFSNLSHEFKTPINLIHSALDLLKLNLKDLNILSAEYENYFNICRKNTYTLLKLANDVIEVAKIETNNFSYHPQLVNIIEVAEDVVDSVVHYCKQNQMKIVFDPEEEEIEVYCDYLLVERIILNLISNAIKYSCGKEIFVSISREGKNVRIIVQDDGIGIPEDKLSSIFEKFTQIPNTFTERRQGSGLGLYLVKEWTEAHSGSIRVSSKLGKGTRFTIEIPQCEQDNQYKQECIKEKVAFELCDLERP